MKEVACSILLSIACCITAFGQIFPKDSLLYNGSVNKFINLVILPDGYTSAELVKFKADATTLMNYLFTQVPFSRYKNYFNVYTVNVPSNQSGVIHPHTATDCGTDVTVTNPDIYFKSTMDYAGLHRFLVADLGIVNFTLGQNFPQWDLVLILVNTTKYGGSGGTFSVVSNDPNAAEVAVHEIGHSFGGLRDEYYPGASYMLDKANTSKESNSSLVRWNHWIGASSAGVFQFAEDTTWHRPHQNCIMRSIDNTFCPYCRELVIEKIHAMINAIDAYTPTTTTVTVTDESIPFAIKTIKPVPNTLKIAWMLDGSEYAKNVDTLFLDSKVLSKGMHTLVATVLDTTKSVKIASHATAHLYSIQWTINNLATSISINSLPFKTIVNTYPNPFQDNLTISYTLENTSNVRVDLLDINGTRIQTLVNQNFVEAGKYEHTANISAYNLPPGLYLIRYTINGYNYTKRIVKE